MSGSEGRFPKSLIEFQGRFATESACAEYLFERRWPEGFGCPGCGDGRAWLLKTKAFTYDCAACERQTSVTAGTIICQQAAANHVILGSISDADALQRHLGAATTEPARPRLVPNRLDVVRQAAPRHGQPGTRAAVRRRRGR